MTEIAKSLGLIAIVCSAAVQAQVSHVSINSRMFAVGAYPKMRVNVISDNQDMTRLKFVLHQSSGEETLMAEQLNRFLVLLTGVEDVTDPKARLLVREYRVDRWYEVKNLPLFESEDGATPPKKAAADVRGSAKAVAGHLPTMHAQPSLSAPILTAGDKASAVSPQSGACLLDYRRETLWRVANRYAETWQVSVYGAMLAIYDANPKAFANQRITALKQDANLICPSPEILAQYPDAKAAKASFLARSAGK